MIAALALLVIAPHLPAADATEVTRLLVLDLEAVGVDKDVARAVDQVLLGAASTEGIEVLAQSELKKMAEMEANKAEFGCDTSSCLAELAGAMGARLVLFGTVSKLGSSTTVSLTLFDSKASSMARDNVSVKDLGALSDELPPRVRALLARAVPSAQARTASAPVAPPPPPAEPPSSLFMGGVVATVVGGAAIVGGGGYAGINEASIQDPAAAGGTKATAQENGLVGLVVAAIGLAIGAAGVALMVVGGDS